MSIAEPKDGSFFFGKDIDICETQTCHQAAWVIHLGILGDRGTILGQLGAQQQTPWGPGPRLRWFSMSCSGALEQQSVFCTCSF